MYFSARSKVGIILSLAAIVTIVGAFMVSAIASRGATTHASSGLPSTTAHGKLLHSSGVKGHPHTVHHAKAGKPKVIALRSVPKTAGHASKSHSSGAPGGASLDNSAVAKGHTAEGQLLQNFLGITDLSQTTVNGGFLNEVTPPDQGLCVGIDPLTGTEAVFELNNLSVKETNPDGSLNPGFLLPVEAPLAFLFPADVFGEFGDPMCVYDKANGTFFFTQIGLDPTDSFFLTDLSVYNANGFASYQVDTSNGGVDFPDQPRIGYDRWNVIITVNEFNNFTGGYDGASVLAASMSQLVFEDAVVESVFFAPQSLGGIPITTLEPARSNQKTGTGFLVNAFPYDQFGLNNNFEKFLGFWKLANGEDVTDGNFANVTLSGN